MSTVEARLRRCCRLWFTVHEPMKLITAHKILIGSAIIFFVFFALWELNRFFNIKETWTLVRAGLYLVVALGFAVYFANLKRWYK